MSRWISADYLKGLIKNNRLLQGNCEYALWEQEADRIVDSQPSIDIVRCKECRWWLKNLTEDDEDEAYLHCPIEDGKPDDFCSYGEPKEISTDCAWK